MKPPLSRILRILALLAAAVLVLSLPVLLTPQEAAIPGTEATERTLLRIWTVNAPGGAQAWLTAQLRTWEKQHPGVMTYLRQVSPEELADPEAVLPDMVLYMPGDITAPEELFLPLSGEMPVREALLRCGRWQGEQYGLPLCWGAWVLAIDSAAEPGAATTPAPTTLLGRPAATPMVSSTEAPYPLEGVSRADCTLRSPGGAALLTLMRTLGGALPPLPEGFGQSSAPAVYAAFQARTCASAMLTTGQVTALEGLVSAGKTSAFRVMTAEEIITDQVWLASLTPGTAPASAQLLGWLVSRDGQETLSTQGLHTVREDLTLYAAGTPARVEQAAQRALSAVNAYIPAEDVSSAAWQVLQGRMDFSQALLPLL